MRPPFHGRWDEMFRWSAIARRASTSEPLESVGQLGSAFGLVRELCDEQGEGLEVACHSQGPRVLGLEPGVTYQSRDEILRARMVPAVEERRPLGRASGLEHREQHLARYGTE